MEQRPPSAYLQFTDQENSFRSELRTWLEANVDPNWRNKYRTEDELAEFSRKWDAKLFEGGWSAIWWPTEYGGRSASAVENAIFAEENARVDAPEGLSRLGKRLVAPLLMAYGTESQKRHLQSILEGSEVWCQGFSEPDAGSDLANLRTRGRQIAGGWIIDGLKYWTSLAQYSDHCLVLARTGLPDSRDRGISVFLVDMRLPGITISPIRQSSGRSDFNSITFDNVALPTDALVGELDRGWSIVATVLIRERGAEYCLARFLDIRRNFESVVRAVQHQPHPPGVGAQVGRMYARIFAIQLAAYDLLGYEQAGAVPPGLDSMVKLYTTETWRALGQESVAALSANDWQWLGDQQVEDYFESQHYTISAGTSEIQRNTIARRVLDLPSSKPSRP